MKHRFCSGALALALLISQGCTLTPCMLDECDTTRRDVTGNWETDILGQWQARLGSGPTYMHQFGDNGAYSAVVLCDHGEYVQPGERSEGFYSFDGEELTIYRSQGIEPEDGDSSRPTYTIESISEREMVATAYSRGPDDDTESYSLVFTRVQCQF